MWVHLRLQLLLKVNVLHLVPMALTIGTRSLVQPLKKCLLGAAMPDIGWQSFSRKLVAASRTLVTWVIAVGLGEDSLSLYPLMVRRAIFSPDVSLVRSTFPRPWYRPKSLENDTAAYLPILRLTPHVPTA